MNTLRKEIRCEVKTIFDNTFKEYLFKEYDINATRRQMEAFRVLTFIEEKSLFIKQLILKLKNYLKNALNPEERKEISNLLDYAQKMQKLMSTHHKTARILTKREKKIANELKALAKKDKGDPFLYETGKHLTKIHKAAAGDVMEIYHRAYRVTKNLESELKKIEKRTNFLGVNK